VASRRACVDGADTPAANGLSHCDPNSTAEGDEIQALHGVSPENRGYAASEKILENRPVKKWRLWEKTSVRTCGSHLLPLKIKRFQATDGKKFLTLYAFIELIARYQKWAGKEWIFGQISFFSVKIWVWGSQSLIPRRRADAGGARSRIEIHGVSGD
jgi:hypothetical protein